jgi:hypothetical protein
MRAPQPQTEASLFPPLPAESSDESEEGSHQVLLREAVTTTSRPSSMHAWAQMSSPPWDSNW